MKNNKINDLLKKINIDNITECEKEIFTQSMTHSSYKNENKNLASDYERLECLGDSIVQKIVSEYLYKKFPHYNEKNITESRKKIVQTKTMIKASVELNLISYSFLGKGVNIKTDTDKIKCDLFESLIGAIYITRGEDKCKFIIEDTIIKYFLNNELKESIDYKSKIQEIFQSNQSNNKKNKNNLFYKSIQNKNNFEVTLIFNGIEYGKGSGKTKKEAEQKAAKNALSKHNNK